MERLLYERSERYPGPACRLVAVGDIMLSGAVAQRYPNGVGAQRIFAEVVSILKSGDIVFGNLETPLCSPPSDRRLFSADPGMAEVLVKGGFTILSLANNHILEYGPDGLRESMARLQEHGIAILGAGASREEAGRPVVLEAHGLRVAFIGLGRTLQNQPDADVPGFVEWEESRAVEMVRNARGRADVVVVSLHIGFMWIDYPKPAFKEAADRLIASGADVVLMHHAHVLQGYHAAAGRLIIYNLGNFVADIHEGETGVTPVPDLQRQSAIFRIDLDRGGVARVEAVPIIADDEFCVRPAPDTVARSILDRLERISIAIGDGSYRDGFNRQRASLTTGNTLAWLFVHLRRGNWKELFGNVGRARPEHLAMLGRYLAGRLGGWWRRRGEHTTSRRSV
jgi:poly-gamma-glutamate capsule biosynthesis protein CapA/YwtB (metallophosphatase superfamily)